MEEPGEKKRTVRSLYPWEKQEALLVFGDQLNYERVRIHENNLWPDRVNNFGRRLKKLPPAEAHNAITLGYHCIFPVRLPVELQGDGLQQLWLTSWLIHELTHAWQYQKLGWRYLYLAITSQLREKGTVYDYGGETGLLQRRQESWTIDKFNLEQQGDIAAEYYRRLKTGGSRVAFQPFIDDIYDHSGGWGSSVA